MIYAVMRWRGGGVAMLVAMCQACGGHRGEFALLVVMAVSRFGIFGKFALLLRGGGT